MGPKISSVAATNHFASRPVQQDADEGVMPLTVMPADDSKAWEQTLETLDQRDLCQFYTDLSDAVEQKKWPEVLTKLDIVLQEHIPIVNDFMNMGVLAGKVYCYEQMQNYEQALAALERALPLWEKHRPLLLEQAILKERVAEVSHAIALCRGGLLLLVGKQQEAVEVLRNNQPTATNGDTSGALFYRMIEKKLNATLLIPQEVTDENNLKQLFFAQRYEEVVQKARQTPDFPHDSLEDDCCSVHEEALLSCYLSALGMLGKFDEIFTEEGELCDELQFLDVIFDQTFNGSCIRVLAGLDTHLPDHIKEEPHWNPLVEWLSH